MSSINILAISFTFVSLGSISLGMYLEQLIQKFNGKNVEPNYLFVWFTIIMSLIVGIINYINISAKKD